MINRTRRRDIGEFTVRKPETVTIEFTPQERQLHDDLLATQAAILIRLHGTIDLQKKFRVPLRGQRTERLTVARHQSHDLVGHLSKVQQRFVHLCL